MGLLKKGIFKNGTFRFERNKMPQNGMVRFVSLKSNGKKTKFVKIDSCKIKTL